jgi:hypothetical protein
MCATNNCGDTIFIRDDALNAVAEEKGSLSLARDFVTTFTTNPSAREVGDFTIPHMEMLYAIVPSENIHSRTLGVIVLRFLHKVS